MEMEESEKLSPPFWLEKLVAWQYNLGQLIKAERKLINLERTEEHLRIDQKKSGTQYYLIEKKGQKIGKYIPKKNIKFVKKLAQNKYNVKIFPELERQYEIIDRFLHNYEKLDNESFTIYNLEKYYEMLSPARKNLVVPIIFPDKLYANYWNQNKIKEKNKQIFMPEGKIFATRAGENVRSKSEVIIADALKNHNIPYFYELPIKAGKIFYPDFTCLNVHMRKEYIWEHLGLMDNAEYASKCANKIILYEKYGYYLGKNLIITMETSDLPLTPQRVEKVIQEYLL